MLIMFYFVSALTPRTKFNENYRSYHRASLKVTVVPKLLGLPTTSLGFLPQFKLDVCQWLGHPTSRDNVTSILSPSYIVRESSIDLRIGTMDWAVRR